MNKYFIEEIDKIIEKVNSITTDGLKTIDIDYLKCYRKENLLFIGSLFDTSFLTNMGDIFASLSSIKMPIKAFKCYVVLVIDLDKNLYKNHRLFTFPINVDLVSSRRTDASFYTSIIEPQILKDPLHIKFVLDYIFRTSSINATIPISPTDSEYFTIRGNYKVEMDFNIKELINKYTKHVDNRWGSNASFFDPYYSNVKISREYLVGELECVCVDNPNNLSYICKTCISSKDKLVCSNHHFKKCSCGKYTYYRRNMCVKCYLKYTRSKKVDKFFLRESYTNRSLLAYIPYLHYNQSNSGLCLGNGNEVINSMIVNNINPIRLMLSFKANLSYTDADSTTNYYQRYNKSIEYSHFSRYTEYMSYLNAIFRKNNVNINSHIFSLYCYCSQCIFVKIVMVKTNRLFHKRIVDTPQTYLISRDKFIELYKYYLSKINSKSYLNTSIHLDIKSSVNTKPSSLIIE